MRRALPASNGRRVRAPSASSNSPLEAAPTVTLTLNAGSAVPVIAAVVNAASFVAGSRPRLAGNALRRQSERRQSCRSTAWIVRPFYASDTQVNFYIPAETPLGANVITVTAPSGVQVSATIDLVAVQPGIFSGAVVHSGTTVSALTTPVRAGEFI